MRATTRDQAAPSLGRDREQSLLRSVLDEVATRGQALVLSGDAGVGKSRLLAYAAGTARGARHVGAEARLGCSPKRTSRSRVWSATATGARARGRVAPRPARSARWCFRPNARGRPRALSNCDGGPGSAGSEVAADAPLLLFVDDVQWLDRPTLDALTFIARRIASDPVVLLAAIRDGYPSLLGDAGVPEHRLVGLDNTTAEALLDACAPQLPVAALAALNDNWRVRPRQRARRRWPAGRGASFRPHRAALVSAGAVSRPCIRGRRSCPPRRGCARQR